MSRVFKPLRCLLSVNGKPCGRYLADIEAGKPIVIRFTCPIKHRHDDGNNRIEFEQDENGLISWKPLGDNEVKIYNDDGMRAAK